MFISIFFKTKSKYKIYSWLPWGGGAKNIINLDENVIELKDDEGYIEEAADAMAMLYAK